jgi:hypothetical protein
MKRKKFKRPKGWGLRKPPAPTELPELEIERVDGVAVLKRFCWGTETWVHYNFEPMETEVHNAQTFARVRRVERVDELKKHFGQTRFAKIANDCDWQAIILQNQTAKTIVAGAMSSLLHRPEATVLRYSRKKKGT